MPGIRKLVRMGRFVCYWLNVRYLQSSFQDKRRIGSIWYGLILDQPWPTSEPDQPLYFAVLALRKFDPFASALRMVAIGRFTHANHAARRFRSPHSCCRRI